MNYSFPLYQRGLVAFQCIAVITVFIPFFVIMVSLLSYVTFLSDIDDMTVGAKEVLDQGKVYKVTMGSQDIFVQSRARASNFFDPDVEGDVSPIVTMLEKSNIHIDNQLAQQGVRSKQTQLLSGIAFLHFNHWKENSSASKDIEFWKPTDIPETPHCKRYISTTESKEEAESNKSFFYVCGFPETQDIFSKYTKDYVEGFGNIVINRSLVDSTLPQSNGARHQMMRITERTHTAQVGNWTPFQRFNAVAGVTVEVPYSSSVLSDYIPNIKSYSSTITFPLENKY